MLQPGQVGAVSWGHMPTTVVEVEISQDQGVLTNLETEEPRKKVNWLFLGGEAMTTTPPAQH